MPIPRCPLCGNKSENGGCCIDNNNEFYCNECVEFNSNEAEPYVFNCESFQHETPYLNSYRENQYNKKLVQCWYKKYDDLITELRKLTDF